MNVYSIAMEALNSNIEGYIVPTTPCKDANDTFSQGHTAGGVLNFRFSRDLVDSSFQLNLNLLNS